MTLNKNVAVGMYARGKGSLVVNAVDYVGKTFYSHLLKLLLKMVFGSLVSYNWTLPRVFGE